MTESDSSKLSASYASTPNSAIEKLAPETSAAEAATAEPAAAKPAGAHASPAAKTVSPRLPSTAAETISKTAKRSRVSEGLVGAGP
jgi:hypothetical protein